MPKFLTTSGTSYAIEDIIINAKKELVLITPYLKLTRILTERLSDADNRGVHIKLVYGKSELHSSEQKRLTSFANLDLLFLENLHAKCYYNETTLIVSSMNLYEFSEKNNREMGIVLTRHQDRECFTDALAEAHSIMAASRLVKGAKVTVVETAPVALDKEFDRVLVVKNIQAMLGQLVPETERFNLKVNPDEFGWGKSSVVTVSAFPRQGIDFTFDGTIRFDFANRAEYDHLKKSKREEIDRLLTEYRCYWNRDVIQIYGAKSYEPEDEQASAQYHYQAIGILLPFLKSAVAFSHR